MLLHVFTARVDKYPLKFVCTLSESAENVLFDWIRTRRC